MVHNCRLCVLLLIVIGTQIKIASAQVLTSDDLIRAGVTRLSDLLELAHEWAGSSTEGYHWSIAPIGLSWEASPDWSLFIDDQPIDVRGLDHQGLNDLPLAVTEICEIRLHSTPVVIGGIIASGGAIELRRCIPEIGFALGGQFSAGNETGDPGPYKYTTKAVPNVDRTGPMIHGSLSAASENLFLRMTAATDEHHVTDPRIRPRVLELYQGEKDARILYRALSIDSKVFDYQFSAGYSRVQDLMFLPIMAREIPIDKDIGHVSASYVSSKIGLSLSINSVELFARNNKENVPLHYTQGRIFAHAFGLGSQIRFVNLNYGLTAELSQLSHGVNQMEDHLGSLRMYAMAQTSPTRDFQISTTGALTYDTGVFGYEVFSHAMHHGRRLSARILIRHRAVTSKMNFAGWVSRGLKLEGSTMLDFPLGLRSRESVYRVDFSWTVGTRMRVRLTGGLGRYVNYFRPFTKLNINPINSRLQSVTQIASTQGNILTKSVRIHIPISDQLRFKMSGSYLYPWSSHDLFKNAWIHRMQFGVRGEFQPNKRFSIDMRLRYVGSRVWKEYQEVAEENPELYTMELPGAVHLDLTVQKRFLGDRLRVNATMRNALDHPHLSHPAGARTNALFQVGLNYAFRVKKNG